VDGPNITGCGSPGHKRDPGSFFRGQHAHVVSMGPGVGDEHNDPGQCHSPSERIASDPDRQHRWMVKRRMVSRARQHVSRPHRLRGHRRPDNGRHSHRRSRASGAIRHWIASARGWVVLAAAFPTCDFQLKLRALRRGPRTPNGELPPPDFRQIEVFHRQPLDRCAKFADAFEKPWPPEQVVAAPGPAVCQHAARHAVDQWLTRPIGWGPAR